MSGRRLAAVATAVLSVAALSSCAAVQRELGSMGGGGASATPAPASTSYAYNASPDGTTDRNRWSVCDGPILWQFDYTIPMSQGDQMAWSQAMNDVAAVTGFDVRWAGEAGAERLPGVRIVVGLRPLDGNTGWSTIYPYANGRIAWASAYMRPGLDQRRKRNAALHEIGHVFGLAHVNDRTQVMWPEDLDRPAQSYQAGDRAGLAGLDASQPCLG